MKNKLLLFIILLISISCTNLSGRLTLQEASITEGFNYPYYLFIPDGIKQENNYLIVEPNNTGFVSDDMTDHIEGAENQIKNSGGIGKMLSKELKYPLLVPVFPRPESEWTIYTHALDRDAMTQQGNTLKRIDLQLLSMVAHAKKLLAKDTLAINPQVLMTGFSASGTFVNRFTAIHPAKVLASAAGGLNAILMLPLKKMNDQQLNYPLGINDFNSITGKPFDAVQFKSTSQFLYMGALDHNDAAPYEDAYSISERELIYALLGEKMLPDRWNKCVNVYRNYGVTGELNTYPNIGHEPTESIQQDILSFFKASIAQQ